MQTLMQPVIEPLVSFGECLKGILAKRKVSGSELARLMAYKSRNSIFRILDEEGGHSARQAFLDRLIGEDPLSLTQEEKLALSQALEISRVGVSSFLSSRAMRDLLMDNGTVETGGRISVTESDGVETCIISDTLRNMSEIEVLVIGCCTRWVFESMSAFFREGERSGSVTHIVYMDEKTAVSNISAIQPMLYHPGYMAYCVEPGMFIPQREGLYRSNWVITRYRDSDGRKYAQIFLLIDDGRFFAFDRRDESDYRMLSRIFGQDISKMMPLKTNFRASAVSDYLTYIEECLNLEAGRATYTIKLDIPLSCVDTEILLPMAKEGFAGMADENVLSWLMNEMERVHRLRFENMFSKKKSTHMIFSREAMERFARTGRQSDHLHVLSAFTPQARVKILRNLQEQTAGNPSFSAYFFRQDFEPPLTEVGLYEGEGTLLTKPYTHYDLSGDHAESIIREEEFCRQYKRFFTQDLLERHVLDKEETLRVFDELIEIAANA